MATLEALASESLDQDPAVLGRLRKGIMRRYPMMGPPFMAVEALIRRLGRTDGDQIALRLTAP